jgi:hypothetical protein
MSRFGGANASDAVGMEGRVTSCPCFFISGMSFLDILFFLLLKSLRLSVQGRTQTEFFMLLLQAETSS